MDKPSSMLWNHPLSIGEIVGLLGISVALGKQGQRQYWQGVRCADNIVATWLTDGQYRP